MLRQLLQSEKFDIFGAQEPYLTQIKDIEPFLDGYTWVGENVIGDKTAQRRHYNPVFYRKDKFEVLDMGSFWYSETPSAPGSKGWDSYSPPCATGCISASARTDGNSTISIRTSTT